MDHSAHFVYNDGISISSSKQSVQLGQQEFWTKSRCIALIAQLSSKIDLLRQFNQENRLSKESLNSSQSASSSVGGCHETKKQRVKHASSHSGYAKRSKRTYSSRFSDRLSAQSPAIHQNSLKAASEEGALPSTLGRLHNDILETFRYIFRMSIPQPSNKGPIGPRALSSICFSSLLDYTSSNKQSAWLETSEGKNLTHTTALDIYKELDWLWDTHSGWKYIRIAIRAHSLAIIRVAATAGLLEPALLDSFVNIILRYGTEREAVPLIVISLHGLPPPQSIYSQLWSCCPLSNNFSLYSTIGDRLESSVLSPAWIMTREFETMWKIALTASSKRKHSAEALHFVRAVLHTLYNCTSPSMSTASSQRYQGVIMYDPESLMMERLAVICSVYITNDSSEVQRASVQGVPAQNTMRRICIDILQTILLDSRILWSTEYGYADILIVFAHMLLESTSSPLTLQGLQVYLERVLSLLAAASSDRASLLQASERLVDFTVTVAKNCGLACRDEVLKYLKMIHMNLESWAYTLREGADYLLEIINDSAYKLAQKVPGSGTLRYAEETSTRLLKARAAMANSKGKFRWEEGIQEWVPTSPKKNSVLQETSNLRESFQGMERCKSLKSSSDLTHTSEEIASVHEIFEAMDKTTSYLDRENLLVQTRKPGCLKNTSAGFMKKRTDYEEALSLAIEKRAPAGLDDEDDELRIDDLPSIIREYSYKKRKGGSLNSRLRRKRRTGRNSKETVVRASSDDELSLCQAW